MADLVMNIALGRVNEFVNRVDANDPANSALIIVALFSSGLEADATLRDYNDLSALLAAANNEATNSGYARKVLTDTALALGTPDDTNNRLDADFADPVWTAVAAAGGAWGALLVCYDSDTTAGTDANIIPMTKHDFAITPDGSDITGQVNAAGFYRAQG